jgi:peptide/nickel transport system substrate-binding protein
VSLTDQNVSTVAYDGLVAYRRVGGIGGGTLVGNLAVRVPRPTDQGRTYTFQLRRGIRYSNGATVRASDFRYSLERLLTIDRQFASGYYNGIVGASKCSARPPARCDLSAGIEVDDAAGRITIHLAQADPDFLHKLALPLASIIPRRTPLRAARHQAIPGTGPYRIAQVEPNGTVRLARNPHFRVWSPDGHPDGYPDEIRFRQVDADDSAASLASVASGDADWISLGGLPGERLRAVLTRYAGRVHTDPAPLTFRIFLNVQVPPFDDLRVRRALNFAVDRRRLIAPAGGAPFFGLTCQILPPGFPGYRPYCPYTLRPNAAGTWTAPDLERAKALVAASGTRGMRVEYVAWESPNVLAVARYWVRLLRRLGYRSSLRVIPDFVDYNKYVGDSRHRAQLGLTGWYAATLTPSDFLRTLFSCASFLPKNPANFNVSEFCDRGIDRKIRRAAAAQTSDPARANELWADVDHALVDRAAAVPTVNVRDRVFVSARVGNYQSHPLWGTLLDQLWVK